MRWTWFASVVVLLVLGTARCWGQASPANDLGDSENDNLIMNASKARTWADGATNVVMLEGPVRIDLDRTKM